MKPEQQIEKILLDMEWCHAVKTKSLETATQAITQLIQEARVEELNDIELVYLQNAGGFDDELATTLHNLSTYVHERIAHLKGEKA